MGWLWMYKTSEGRDLRIDFLRGYALFMMIIDHVGPEWLPNNQGGQSYLYNLTGAGMFYTSAAEIFYFVSGLTLGLVCASSAFEQAIKRVLGRTWTLYYTVILMSLGFSALYHVFPGINLWSIYDQAKQNYAAFALQTLTLQVTGHGAEILVLYVIFMMFMPPALWMLFMRRWYVVVLASAVIYAIAQIFPDYQSANFTLTTYFPTFTWQPLFFLGLVIGFHRQNLAQFWDQWPQFRTALEISVVFAALAFLWVFVGKFALWPELPILLGGFDDQGRAIRESMTPVRLALVGLYLQAAYILISWLWTPLHRVLGWLLELLGRQSLWAFVAHMAVYVVLHNLSAFNEYTGNHWWWQLLGVMIVWGFIRLYEPVASAILARGKMQTRTNPPPEPALELTYPAPQTSWSKGWIALDDALFLRESTNQMQDSFEREMQVRPKEQPLSGSQTLPAATGLSDPSNSSHTSFRGSRWQPRGELIGAAPISRALEAQPHAQHRSEITAPSNPHVQPEHIPSGIQDSSPMLEGLNSPKLEQLSTSHQTIQTKTRVEPLAESQAETAPESRHELPPSSVLEPTTPGMVQTPVPGPALSGPASGITASDLVAENAASDTTSKANTVLETPVASGVEEREHHPNKMPAPVTMPQPDQEPLSAQGNPELALAATLAGKSKSSKKKTGGSGKKNTKKSGKKGNQRR
jgi:hypothetical protein